MILSGDKALRVRLSDTPLTRIDALIATCERAPPDVRRYGRSVVVGRDEAGMDTDED